MPTTAIVSGLLLIAVGVGGYTAASDQDQSPTALIPAAVGIVIALLGAVAVAKPSARKHAMHAAAGVGLLGLLAAGGRLAMVLARDQGSTLARLSLAAMALICAVFLALCVKSFRDARRARAGGTTL